MRILSVFDLLLQGIKPFASGGQGEGAWRMALCALPWTREASAKAFY